MRFVSTAAARTRIRARVFRESSPCRRGLRLSPDPVSRTYASMQLAFALLEKGERAEAVPVLDQARHLVKDNLLVAGQG